MGSHCLFLIMKFLLLAALLVILGRGEASTIYSEMRKPCGNHGHVCHGGRCCQHGQICCPDSDACANAYGSCPSNSCPDGEYVCKGNGYDEVCCKIGLECCNKRGHSHCGRHGHCDDKDYGFDFLFRP